MNQRLTILPEKLSATKALWTDGVIAFLQNCFIR